MMNNYGAPYDAHGPQRANSVIRSSQLRTQKKRLNILSMCWVLVIPTIIFIFVLAAMSFSLPYYKPIAVVCIVCAFLLIVLYTGYLAVTVWRAKKAGYPREPSWYIFLFIVCALAWVIALCLGCYNYYANLYFYYEITNLNYYTGVNPAEVKGQQVQDAGRIEFVTTAYLQTNISKGYTHTDVYCVAPIVYGDDMTTYDFWAVGINCCGGATSTDFECGDYDDSDAHSAFINLDDSADTYYKLAVEQIESMYGITANYPLFFKWTEDVSLSSNQSDAESFYKYALIGWLLFMVFAIIVAALVFMRTGTD